MNLCDLQKMENELKELRIRRESVQANTKDIDQQLELIRLAKLGLHVS